MNKILCFDTSNNCCSAAISFGQDIIAYSEEKCPSMQAERLMVIIEETLIKAKLKYQDLTQLAVTTGPGSFTGIRIGLSAAKAILHACDNLQEVAITNFEASYYRLTQQIKSYNKGIICINAYRGQQYLQIFNENGKADEPMLVGNKEAAEIINSLPGNNACSGSGLAEIYDEIKNIDNLTVLPRFPAIKAMQIARLADKKIKRKEIKAIEPLYIRPPDAIPPKK